MIALRGRATDGNDLHLNTVSARGRRFERQTALTGHQDTDGGESKPLECPRWGSLDTMPHICVIARLAKCDPTTRINGRYFCTTISEIGSSTSAHKSLKRKTGGIQ